VKLIEYVVLPREITQFERDYLARMHRVAWWFFVAHVPVFAIIAAFNGTNALLVTALSVAALAGPFLARRALTNPRKISVVYGITAMAMGGVLVTAGRGAMTIEMHFYFFVLLALLTVFADPMPIVAAAVTAALHHLILWALYPQAVFNYDAPVWAVAVHALFVVLESIAAVFVARSFFDNVIGLERIVRSRTAALDARNGDLRRVLDNVGQGFVLLGRDAVVPAERAAVFDAWFGPCVEGETLHDCLARRAPESAGWFRFGWEEVFDGALPMDVSLAQLPRRVVAGERALDVEYRLVDEGAAPKVLLVITDVTERLAQEENERAQREVVVAFSRAVGDRAGFVAFLEETERLLDEVDDADLDDASRKRALHTVKGNAAVFGLLRFAEACHALEDQAAEVGALNAADVAALRDVWRGFLSRVTEALGPSTQGQVSLDRDELERLRAALRDRRVGPEELLHQVNRWLLDPVRPRLEQLAQQAERLAASLGYAHLDVRVEDGDARVQGARWRPLWAAMIHLVRNAVDHGVDTPEERAAAGKAPRATIVLRAEESAGAMVIEVRDDGRGIDRTTLEARARQRGLELGAEDAVFVDGLSTRDVVSENSGRGVGMSAVRAVCASLGGTVRVTSAAGEGTTVRIVSPSRGSMLPAAMPANDTDAATRVA